MIEYKTLNEFEQKAVEWLAGRRRQYNRMSGSFNRECGDMTDEDRDIMGCGGEWFIAREINAYPDTVIGKHPLYDLKLDDGTTIDVKTSSNPDGPLYVFKNKELNPCSYYMLVIGDHPRYAFVGYTTCEFVFQDRFLMERRFGPTYVIPQRQLMQPSSWEISRLRIPYL